MLSETWMEHQIATSPSSTPHSRDLFICSNAQTLPLKVKPGGLREVPDTGWCHTLSTRLRRQVTMDAPALAARSPANAALDAENPSLTVESVSKCIVVEVGEIGGPVGC